MTTNSELADALMRIHAQIDAQASRALRVIRAMAERDRRAIGQLTRYDHIQRRLNK